MVVNSPLAVLRISLLVAFVFALAQGVIPNESRHYLSKLDQGQVNSMNYQEGKAYIADIWQKHSYWRKLTSSFRSTHFWKHFILDWALFTICAGSAILLFQRKSSY